MYKVRTNQGGPFSLQLEKGSTTVQPGKSFDVEKVCSREWINTNQTFRSLISRGIIMVLFDSLADLPKTDLRAPARKPVQSGKPVVRKRPKTPTVIDLAAEPEVADDFEEVERSTVPTVIIPDPPEESKTSGEASPEAQRVFEETFEEEPSGAREDASVTTEATDEGLGTFEDDEDQGGDPEGPEDTDEEPEVEEKPEEEQVHYTAYKLKKYLKPVLVDIAESFGVDVGDKTKKQLVRAIMIAQKN